MLFHGTKVAHNIKMINLITTASGTTIQTASKRKPIKELIGLNRIWSEEKEVIKTHSLIHYRSGYTIIQQPYPKF